MQKLDTETLYKVYKALNKRFKRLKTQLDRIDEKIERCNKMEKDSLLVSRKTLADTLYGLNIAIDTVFRAITQDKL